MRSLVGAETNKMGCSYGRGLEIDFGEDGFEVGLEVVDRAVVEDVVVGHGDGGAFLEAFDFAEVAVADFGGGEGALGAMGEALVAEAFRNDDGDRGEQAGELVLKKLILSPRIETVEDDAFLAGRDEVFGFGDGLATDPIVAFGIANHLAELTLGLGGDFDAAFFHFFVEHAAEVDFGHAAFSEEVDDRGFAAAAHAKNGENFDVFVALHILDIIA